METDVERKPEQGRQLIIWGATISVLVAGLWYLAFQATSPRMPEPTLESQIRQYRMVADFDLLDRNGKPFNQEALSGKVWVANLVFTSCAVECPVLCGRLAQVQARFRSDDRVRLVSFSVDPQTDRPERMKAYAERFGAGENWFFVTGDSAELDRLIQKSFLLPVATGEREAGKGSGNLVHSEKLLVVDQLGVVRYYTEGLTVGAVERVIRVIEMLLAAPETPSAESPSGEQKPLATL